MARAVRIACDVALSVAKVIRPAAGTTWHYAKTEMVPPMTIDFFNGPVGKNLENTVAGIADGIIGGIQKQIRDMDAEVERKKREKEAAIKAAEEKAKAEAMAREEEKKIKAAAAKAKKAEELKKEAEKKAAAEVKAKPKEESKKVDKKKKPEKRAPSKKKTDPKK